MNLRAEIRTAIDEVAPPAPALSHQVTTFVLRHDKRRAASPSSPSRSTNPGRTALSLVAAGLIVVVMGALVVGGRLWRDFNTVPQVTINQSELHKLEARPLLLPVVQPGAECPGGPVTNTAATHGGSPLMYGDGPVYATSGQRGATSWGTWMGVMYLIDPSTTGQVLIRARDLQTGEAIVFDGFKFSTRGMSAAIPAGTAHGNDSLLGGTLPVHKYPELVIDPSVPTGLPHAWPAWGALVGYSNQASGCIGFQVDGADFSETYVVNEADA